MYQLRIELPDSLREPLERVAAQMGQTPEAWVRAIVRQRLCQPDDRLRSHFGAVDLGAPTGAANEGIDADLAHSYAHAGD